ncbi:GTP-binding protein RAD-like [Empidonax traillii]|uniref:GTP-binding protein RAD-like n=1 Tax=Empidonax traillii TaxID=164674 RepID=UPI000FFDBB55|nr:GTP-binding protein RAD-like [Empidonax traillii]
MTLNRGDKVRCLERRRGSTPFAQPLHRRSMPVDERDLRSAEPQGLVRCTSYSPGGEHRDSWASDSSDSVISSGSDSDSSLYKVILLGEHGVGKTSLARIFGGVEDGADADEAGNTYDRSIIVDGEEASLVVFDIWEQVLNSFFFVFPLWLGPWALFVLKAGCLFVFCCCFSAVYNEEKKSNLHSCCLFSCPAEGRACAVVFDCKFIETSAALHHNVKDLFEGIVRQIRLRKDSKEDNARRMANTKRRESIGKKAKRFLGRIVAKNNKKMAFKAKSKSCHDLSVL